MSSLTSAPEEQAWDWLDDLDNSEYSPRIVAATITEANADVAAVTYRDQHFNTRTGRLAVSDYVGTHTWQPGDTVIVAEQSEHAKAVVSMTDPRLPANALDGVSPEVRSGKVRVMAVARREGIRTKIAVAATIEGLDPVAACVGRGSARVEQLRNILNEKVDIVAWHPEPVRFLVNALQPADISTAWFDQGKKLALVVAADHQMSTAVGGGGLNALLAGELAGVSVRVIAESKAAAIASRIGPPQYVRAHAGTPQPAGE